MSKYIVVGHFDYPDQLGEAIGHLRERGLSDVRYHSPFPSHELDDEMYHGRRRSSVRVFTLLGGITGCLGGFLMTSWMSVDWPLRTSAKPLISVPAFVVIAFECTILLGAIFTLLGMFHKSRIPNLFRFAGYRPSFSEGTFGIVVRVAKDKTEEIRAQLMKLGATKVEVEYVR